MPQRKSLAEFINSLFSRERVPHHLKAVALTAHEGGLGYRLSARVIQALGTPISHTAVWQWQQRLDGQPLPLRRRKRKRLAADETTVEIDGQRWYVWLVVDVEADEPLAFHVSHAQTIFDAAVVLRQALTWCTNKPRLFTDSAPCYRRASRIVGMRHTICVFGPQSAAERAFAWLEHHLQRLKRAYCKIPVDNVRNLLLRWVSARVTLTMWVRATIS